VLALDMDQINFTKGEFRVTGKGNKVRQCYFGERTSVALRDYIETAKDNTHKALFTERMKSTHLVRRLSYQTAHRDLRDVTSRHKVLKDVRFHDLRHTFATERARIVPIEVLRALLGHEKIQTTLIYQKITSQVARESAMLALKQIAESLH
jgi:integrase/recombinase XerD